MVTKYALILGGIVQNIALGDEAFKTTMESAGHTVVDVTAINVHIGASYDGANFTNPTNRKQLTHNDVWEQIKTERDQRKNGGFLVSGKWFHSDSESLIRYLGLKQLQPTVLARDWKTMDGSFVPLTAGLVDSVYQAAIAHDAACFDNAETHRAAMLNLVDPTDYNYSTGWPDVYQGA